MAIAPRPGSAAPFFAEWTQENAERPSLAQRVRESRGPRNWGAAAALATVVGLGVATLVAPGGAANADPSSNQWSRLRMCESSNNYKINTGNGYYGAYQFDLSTWRSVGGSGYPHQNSKAEQDYRALRLYRQRGWQPWECASILGLRSDSDAGSGRYGDIPKPGSGGSSGGSGGSGGSGSGSSGSTTSGIPAFPGGSHWYVFGETSRNIKTFQDRMHKRGYFPVGTGEYGPNTRAMIMQLQRVNGLVPNGYLGPNTWRLAWTGRYSAPGTGSAPKIPKFPGGSHWYVVGESKPAIRTFQAQLVKRKLLSGANGSYGTSTATVVKRLQKLNGLVPNGYIGPNTWRLAWVGRSG